MVRFVFLISYFGNGIESSWRGIRLSYKDHCIIPERRIKAWSKSVVSKNGEGKLAYEEEQRSQKSVGGGGQVKEALVQAWRERNFSSSLLTVLPLLPESSHLVCG